MKEKKSSAVPALAWVLIVAVVLAVGLTLSWLVFRGPAGEEEGVAEAPATTSPSMPESGPSGQEGGVSSDMWGRRVVVPADDRGDPKTTDLYSTNEQCSPAEEIRVPEGMEIQRTQGASTVWSTSDGPSEITGTLPEGYSRTPAGAALAAWNLYALMNAGGEAGADVIAERTGMSEEKSAEFRQLLEEDGGAGALGQREEWENVAVPDGFRVLSCADDLIIIELAKPLGADVQGPSDKYWQVLRLPMIWEDGHWAINGADNNDVERESISELGAEWSRWEF